MLFKKNKKINEEKEENKWLKEVNKEYLNNLDYEYPMCLSKNENCLRCKDNRYLAIYEIDSIDLLSMGGYERNGIVDNYFQSVNNFKEKFRIISTNQHYNHSTQKKFIAKLKKELVNEENEGIRKFKEKELDRKLEEIEIVEKNTKTKFYALLYGEDLNDIERILTTFHRTFQNERKLRVKLLEGKELLDVVRFLNNRGMAK